MFNLFKKIKKESQINSYILTETKTINFGYKSCWAVVKSESAEDILTVLNKTDSINKNCIDFITKSHSGWVIISDFGMELFNEELGPEYGIDNLKILSTYFETVCYFVSHRISDVYGWFKFQNNKITRAFYCSECEILTDKGLKTMEEINLNMNYSTSDDDFSIPYEDDVIKIAEAWTLNPTYLEQIPGIKSYHITKKNP